MTIREIQRIMRESAAKHQFLALYCAEYDRAIEDRLVAPTNGRG